MQRIWLLQEGNQMLQPISLHHRPSIPSNSLLKMWICAMALSMN